IAMTWFSSRKERALVWYFLQLISNSSCSSLVPEPQVTELSCGYSDSTSYSYNCIKQWLPAKLKLNNITLL
ncbi:TPA: hypothetical protein ACV5QB_001308, partial [Streptococcus equi subsp. equi]